MGEALKCRRTESRLFFHGSAGSWIADYVYIAVTAASVGICLPDCRNPASEGGGDWACVNG